AVNFAEADCHYGYRMSRFKREDAGRYVITHVTYRLSRRFEPRLAYGALRRELDARGIAVSGLTASQLRDLIIDIRRHKLPDPAQVGSAGSFFMNPVVSRDCFERLQAIYPDMPHYDMEDGVKIPAGWMIEHCGWKGRALGPAAVYEKQALVLVNRGGATGADVVRLSEAVCADVKARFGITLHPEVIFV
ncbi:MAG TPA: UDP-N-acetylmuramate dehydrogenase, partial [Candidatus Caccomonas pullistercoris]|nr:UDP-N-acetylmuramate dehydrogenase [Candidatus Caccomonas pullistercoris]